MYSNGFESKELRPHQYEDIFLEEDLPVYDVRKSALRKLLYSGLFLFIIMIVLMAIIEIPLEQTFSFVIKANKQEEIYRFPSLVYVTNIFVKPRQSVKPSMPLMEITSPEIVNLIMEYNTTKRNLEVFYNHDVILYRSQAKDLSLEIADAEQVIQKNIRDKHHLETIRDKDMPQLQFNYKESLRRYNINEKLFESKAISEYELKNSEREKVRTESELKMAREQYEREIANISHELTSLSIKKEVLTQKVLENDMQMNRKNQILKDLHNLAHEKIKLNYGSYEIKSQALQLKSAKEGIISFIYHSDKEVPQGIILLKIISSQSSFYAVSTAIPKRIGYIKENQDVILKVSTFPHYEWGVLRGKVKNLSLAADAEGKYPFEVQIIDQGKIGNLMQIGMTGTLSILIEEKTFFELLFSKFNEAKDRYLE